MTSGVASPGRFSSKTISLAELTRYILKEIAEPPKPQPDAEDTPTLEVARAPITPQQVQGVFKCIGNYINFTLKKHAQDD